MNKIYKLKYDRRRNQLVAVSELTTGAGKETSGQIVAPAGLADISTFRKLMGTLTPLAFLTGLVISLLPGMALANPDLPVGGQIVMGQGSISTNGNQMTINQNTHGMVTNWNSFDIGKNHTVQFVQPDSSAVALNRVTGGHESQILGTLTANGQIMLVNPAGVMFGKGAKVNTAGLVASTKNISNADFMAGHYTFSGGSNPGAEVVNQGSLTTTKGGYIVLAADRVKNSGAIRTPGGKTVLATGETVTLQLDNTGLASVSVTGSVVNALVENHGLLSATDGKVYLTARGKDMLLNTVVNNSGTVEATGLTGQGGEIVLSGGDSGVVNLSGMLLADSGTESGGKITVEGKNIHLAANSRASATGKNGGGEVSVGGGWQGQDSHIHNASKVVMDKAASIDVSATENGNGGTAVLWSDDYTNFRGDILARGGMQGGDGGRVETSSHQNIQAFGDVDASAPVGKGGSWLLDPTDISIEGSSGEEYTIVQGSTDSSGTFVFEAGTATKSQVLAKTISDKLTAGTSVTVRTSGSSSSGTQNGDITVNADIKKSAPDMSGANTSDATLTLDADGNINITKHNITSESGRLDVNLYAAGSKAGTIALKGANISTNGGHITLGRKEANTSPGEGQYLKIDIGKQDSVISELKATDSDNNSGNISITAVNVNAGPALNLDSAKLTGSDITLSGQGVSGSGSGVKITSGELNATGGNLSIIGTEDSTTSVYGINIADTGSKFTAKNKIIFSAKALDGSDGALYLGGGTWNAVNTVLKGESTGKGSGIFLAGNVTVEKGNLELQGTSSGQNSGKSNPPSAAGIDGNGKSITVTDGDLLLNGIVSSGGDRNSGLKLNNVAVETRKGNVTLKGTATEGNQGLSSSGMTISSAGTTELSGSTDWGVAVDLTRLNLTSVGDVTVKGEAPLKAWASGIKLDSSNVESTSGSVNLTGISNADPTSGEDKDRGNTNALKISGSTLKAAEKIILNGTSGYRTGLLVTGSNFTASQMDIHGKAVNQGTGFSFSNSEFRDALNNLTKVTFSSAGSAAGATNSLDSSIVTAGNLTTLMKWLPENMTRIDMNGTYVFNDSGQGWIADYSSESTPAGGYIFNNTKVLAGASVDLKGVGFTDSEVTVHNGDLNIRNAGSAMLRGTTINADNGSVNINSSAGGINLRAGKISAKNDIILNADNGTVTVSGSNSSQANIHTISGNVNISGKNQHGNGVILDSVNVMAEGGKSIININGAGKVDSDPYNGGGAVQFLGKIDFSGNKICVKGNNSHPDGPGVSFGQIIDRAVNLTLNGNASIIGEGMSAGLSFMHDSSISIGGGDLVLEGIVHGENKRGDEHGSGGITFANAYAPNIVTFIQADANVTMKSDVSAAKKINAYDSVGSTDQGKWKNGFKFKGTGNVYVSGESNGGVGADLRYFDNTGLDGLMSVAGKSNSSAGVYFDKVLNVNLVNSSITGTSVSGSGLILQANTGSADLNNNKIVGTSVSGNGIQIDGNNVAIINGSLTGNTTSGTGAGISLNGGTNYTLDGVRVEGTSVDGAGVSAGGSLVVNNGAVLSGTATGSGSGVVIRGDLKNTDGNNVKISGKAESGTGIQIAGNSSLVNASLTGISAAGTGVNVARDLTVSGASTIKGISDKKAGINIAQNLTVTPVTDSGGEITSQASITGESKADGAGVILGAALNGGIVTGISKSGTGVLLADNAKVTRAEVSGQSTTGTGVSVKGNVLLDDKSAAILTATSVSGTGLGLENNASVSIVQTGTQMPVTVPVVLTGKSQTGSGVAISGNASVSGVTLNGATDADGGTGVTLGGHLTITDDISGVSSSATGNGTALKISDGVVDAKGYADAGKTLAISATSENGAAISTRGNSSLSNVELNGTASGNGSAVVISGSLSTDKALTAESTGDKGTALQLSGGHIQSTAADNAPVRVMASATGNGTAVAVTQNESSVLSDIDLGASANKGTVLDIAGDLTTNRDISVSTENGTSISLNGGSLLGADDDHPITVTAQSTGSGTAVTVKPVAEGLPGSMLVNMTLNATSAQGDALNVEGKLNTKDVSVVAETTGTGTALNVNSGGIHSQGGTNIAATSDNGHAAMVTDGKLTGDSAGSLTVTATTTTDNPAVDISGNSSISNSSLKGENKGTGTAVKQSGNTTLANADIAGVTSSGVGSDISGSLTADEKSVVTGNATADGGTGVALNGTLNGTVTGTSDRGVGVHISDGAIITTGSHVKGSSTQGYGTVVSGNITNNGDITGNSVHSDGLVLNTMVTGSGLLAGTSADGAGVYVSGDTSLGGGSLSGTTTNGSGIKMDGNLTYSADTLINTTVTPGGNGQETTGSGTIQVETLPDEPPQDVTPPDIPPVLTPPEGSTAQIQRLLSRQSVISQTPHARPLTQSAGYRPSPHAVDISLCTGEGPCRSLTVNQTLTATPLSGKAISGPEKDAP